MAEEQQNATHRWSTAGGLVAILLWSSTIALTRSLSEQLGPVTAGASVSLLGGILSLLFSVASSRGTPGGAASPWYLWGCGSLFAGYTLVLYLAVGCAESREQVLAVGVVNYLWPSLTVLLSIPVLGQRASGWIVPGTILAFGGVAVVLIEGGGVSWKALAEHLGGRPEAYVLALMAAVSWALYSNLARRWSTPGGRGAVGWFLMGSGILLTLVRLASPESTTWSTRSFVEVTVLGVITAVAYVLWERAMRHGNLLLTAICSYFTPLLSTVASCAYLGVPLSPGVGLGCILLVIGSFVSWRSVRV